MQDAIIKGTGDSRYLKSSVAEGTTWEQFLTSLRDGTLPIDLNGINAAGWTQQGTPLNKASLLKDATAALFGLGTTAVPDDALKAISSKGLPQIGDIKITARTNLGYKWLLCNGATLNGASYPELFSILNQTVTKKTISNSYVNIMDMTCYNGRWVAVGYVTPGNYPYVLTTTNLNTTWSGYQIDTATNYLRGIYCYNGTWVACSVDNSTHYPIIYTTTNPAGTWTKVQINNNMYNGTPQGITCYNGTWVIPVTVSSTTQFLSSTDLTSTSWSVGYSDTAGNVSVNSVACYNGTWVGVGSTGASNTIRPHIFYTTNPAGTWTAQQVYSIKGTLTSICCYNGTWVAVGGDDSNNDNINMPLILTTTNITGTWTAKTFSKSTQYSWGFSKVCYDEMSGTWYAAGRGTNANIPFMYKSTNPAASWSEVTDVEQAFPSGRNSANSLGLACYNGVWVLGLGGYNNTSIPTEALINTVFLPTISLDDSYAYIKALGGV